MGGKAELEERYSKMLQNDLKVWYTISWCRVMLCYVMLCRTVVCGVREASFNVVLIVLSNS